MPPLRQSGLRISPTRARPVPFWRHGFLPLPLTADRFLVCVRAAALGGVLLHHRFPDHPGLDASTEHLFVQLDRADLFVLAVDDVNFHGYQLSAVSFQLASLSPHIGLIAES